MLWKKTFDTRFVSYLLACSRKSINTDLKSPTFDKKKMWQKFGVFRSLVAWEETGGYNNSCCDATSSQGGFN